MSTLTWITEKEIALEEHQQENFIAAVREKMRNASGHQGEQ